MTLTRLTQNEKTRTRSICWAVTAVVMLAAQCLIAQVPGYTIATVVNQNPVTVSL